MANIVSHAMDSKRFVASSDMGAMWEWEIYRSIALKIEMTNQMC